MTPPRRPGAPDTDTRALPSARTSRASKAAWLGLTLAALAWPAAECAGQTAVLNREYAIKAAFLYHFSSYIEWPADQFTSPEAPFVIGVYGANPFGATLDTLASSKKVAGRSIEVRTVASAEEAAACQVLFIPSGVDSGLPPAVATTPHPRLLVVGEAPGFLEAGGDVQFFVESNKVRFAFHEGITGGHDLKVSSKLLALSKPAPPSAPTAPAVP